MKLLLRRLAWVAGLIALVLATGTTGFCVIDNYPLFDAFYMTLITVSTVGYAEIRAAGLSIHF
jgi:voltage-gated potassium channel